MKQAEQRYVWVSQFERQSRELGLIDDPGMESPIEHRQRLHAEARKSSFDAAARLDTSCYARLARGVREHITDRPGFEVFVIAWIVAVGVSAGVDATYLHSSASAPAAARAFIAVVELGSNIVFTLEVGDIVPGASGWAVFFSPRSGSHLVSPRLRAGEGWIRGDVCSSRDARHVRIGRLVSQQRVTSISSSREQLDARSARSSSLRAAALRSRTSRTRARLVL